jgi:hypothetical protein
MPMGVGARGFELNLAPEFDKLPEGADAAIYVKMFNDNRRHETPEDQAERIKARQEDGQAAGGMSNRLATRFLDDLRKPLRNSRLPT